MSAVGDLERAIILLARGKRREAATVLLRLEPGRMDRATRLKFIDASLSSLDRLQHEQGLVDLSLEGIKIAGELGRKNVQAHFMSRRAELLIARRAVVHHGLTSLKLAPTWMGFSTAADKCKYETLWEEFNSIGKEVDNLLAQALEIAEGTGEQRLLAFVLMARGTITSAKYGEFKSDCLRDRLRAKLWVKYQILRYPFFERFVLFGRRDGRRLADLVRSFSHDFLRAAALLENIGDSVACSAYYNLANHLRSTYRFAAARKYLGRARTCAERNGDVLIIQQCQKLSDIIKKRNRDIPDYLRGERREDDN